MTLDQMRSSRRFTLREEDTGFGPVAHKATKTEKNLKRSAFLTSAGRMHHSRGLRVCASFGSRFANVRSPLLPSERLQPPTVFASGCL